MLHRILWITRRSSTAAQIFLSKYSATVGGTHAAPLEWVRCPSISRSKLRRLSKLREGARIHLCSFAPLMSAFDRIAITSAQHADAEFVVRPAPTGTSA